MYEKSKKMIGTAFIAKSNRETILLTLAIFSEKKVSSVIDIFSI